jgi:hypothetical protein
LICPARCCTLEPGFEVVVEHARFHAAAHENLKRWLLRLA